jgi:STE24 endopeptidase
MFIGLREAKQYHRTKLVLSLVGTVAFLVYAVVWAWWGGASLSRLSDNRWVSLFVFAGCFGLLYELLTLPLSYYADYVLEHRYELSNQSLSRWLVQLGKEWLVGGLLAGIALAGLYALLWYGGELWWLWIWGGWLGLTVVLARLFPVLLLPVFYDSEPLQDERITARLTAMADDAALRISGIFSLQLSKDTKAANAMLTGLGSTRRVYLSDTLLEAFELEEIEVVFAHELGHHTRRHIWKLLGLSALVSTLHISVLAYFLHPHHGPDHENVARAITLLPLIAVCLGSLSMIIKPLHNAISRRFERQCDADALRRTRNPQAFRSTMNRLAEMNLADPDPHPFIEWYFYDHPAIYKRIASADDTAIA